MKRAIVCIILACLSVTQISCTEKTKVAAEHQLWPDGIANNLIKYDQPDRMRDENCSHPDSPVKTCRVYSHVTTPTYYIYQPAPGKNIGVGIVVLPGGGYQDIWLDKEGHSIGIYFAERGLTSLVVKYRTNTNDKNGKQQMTRKQYVPIAVADAKEGIRILRSRAAELNIDPQKIGIGGFSAGGHLTLSVCFDETIKDKKSDPDFAFLIYPWFEDIHEKQVSKAKGLPPMFIINGQEDDVCPPEMCASFYEALCGKKVPAEMHIYAKGKHGFSLGFGTGHSTIQWKDSFIQWLKDIDMITD
jgi:acetyl esterase/lipase